MKKLSTVFIVLLLLFGIVGGASANLIKNGDFETGNLGEYWTSSGAVEVVNLGELSSLQGMDNYFVILGLNTTSGESALSQSFTVQDMDQVTISFDWAFDFYDKNWKSDDIFISILSAEGDDNYNFEVTMKELQSGIVYGWGAGLMSGCFTKTYDLSLANNAEVEFILSEGNGWKTGSIAGIDNVSAIVAEFSSSPVPEPATMLLLGSGLAGIAVFARKRRDFKK